MRHVLDCNTPNTCHSMLNIIFSLHIKTKNYHLKYLNVLHWISWFNYIFLLKMVTYGDK